MKDQPSTAAEDSALSPGAAGEEPPASIIERLQAELAEARDRGLRALADLENYRKRVRREQEEDRTYAALPLLRDLLPVLDNSQRAIAAAEKQPESGGLLAGVKLLAQQLETVLSQHHCRRIEALHQPFDPHLHAAILQQPSSDHPPGTVLLVTQDGYQLHDRVLRPAQAIISAPATDPER